MKLQGNQLTTDQSLTTAGGVNADNSLMGIEDIAAAADGMLYCYSQRRSILRTQGKQMESHDATLVRLAEQMDDELWDHLRQLSTMLTAIRSENIRDIRTKIRIWKSLAPESVFDKDEQTADEALLCSIIEDIEQPGAC